MTIPGIGFARVLIPSEKSRNIWYNSWKSLPNLLDDDKPLLQKWQKSESPTVPKKWWLELDLQGKTRTTKDLEELAEISLNSMIRRPTVPISYYVEAHIETQS